MHTAIVSGREVRTQRRSGRVRTDAKEGPVAGVEGVQDEVALPGVGHVRQPETRGPGQERAGVRRQGMPRRQSVGEGDQD